MQTERFNQLRKGALKKIFQKDAITNVWRGIVRDKLRSLDLKDMFDHYDFNYNIEDRSLAIRSEILSGKYKVLQPLIYRIEKKLGVCRHLVIPQPTDALVMQVLVETVAAKILKNQPSENAFYSRDKHNMKYPHQVDQYGLNWRQQWKKLQTKIYNFQEDRDLIVVTDLSNYYDSIDIKELRKVFTSYAKIDEVLVDLLFRIVEEISWKPDYLPYSHRGLPTTGIEAIRLLGHSFLFELDAVVKQKTKNNFTRWMDDIVIGVDTRKEAIETISTISDILKSRGLALNLSKTNIYSDDEGYSHFQIENNRYIDGIENLQRSDPDFKSVCSDLHKRFKVHLQNTDPKYWDKSAKRFITTYGKFKSPNLLRILPKIYLEHPDLRTHLLIYLINMGYRKSTEKVVMEILKNISIFDDLSLYQLCSLVTTWDLPVDANSSSFLLKFEDAITSLSFKRTLPSDVYCLLWFKSKYNHPEDLLKFMVKYQNLWQTDTFLRRQATCVLARLLLHNTNTTRKLLNAQMLSGVIDTVTLATQILRFSRLNSLDARLTPYLFPKSNRPYPLSKFLVLCSVLNSEKIRNDPTVKKRILEQIKDRYFLRWLDLQYNIR
jgi:Reverse transcriptase (RNA-dependent DNA polymerase)